MRLSMTAASKQVQPLVNFPGRINIEPFFRRKNKVVILMGATGTGKSRLAIDLATRFPAEIINSDKMQVYQGYDIVTNKITKEESQGIPHHLLGFVDPNSNFTAIDFQHHATSAVESIVSRDCIPIIAGGSNSYIDALINYNAEFKLNFECCFLWVDVSVPVLHSFVSERVDRMIKSGLIEEVRSKFNPSETNYSQGIRRAIGVPELDKYFRCESTVDDEKTRSEILAAAIDEIKENTCVLACKQLEKIRRLRCRWDWNMHRIDATEVFLKDGEEAEEAWEKLVADPTARIVGKFLYDQDCLVNFVSSSPVSIAATATVAAASY